MPESIMAEICEQYRNTHENLLDLIVDLTDEQIGWTPNATTPSIGFHVWHLARWADYLQEMINGRGSQLWEKEELAIRWNMETASLGYAQTGMSMDDKAAMMLRMPGKDLPLITRAAHLPPPNAPLKESAIRSSTKFMRAFMGKTGTTGISVPSFQPG